MPTEPEDNSDITSQSDIGASSPELFQPDKVTLPVKQTGPKNHKKKLIILASLLTIIVAGTAGWLLTRHKETPVSKANQEPVSAVQAAPVDTTTRLVYAYKEGSTTKVNEVDNKDGTQKELFKFDEMHEISSSEGDFYPDRNPTIELSPDGKTVAFIGKDGLWTRQLDSDAVQQVIKSTAKTLNDGTGFTLYTLDPARSPTNTTGPGGIFGLFEPVWSLDGGTLGFTVGHYEGSHVEAINIKTKKYISAGDTFRYVDFETLKEKFVIEADNKPFLEAGIFADYLLRPVYTARSATYSKDKATIYAILCPKDKPSTGSSTYVPEATNEYGDRRDCSEPENKALISINSKTGSFMEITYGSFTTELIVGADELIYVPEGSENTSKVAIINPKTSEHKTVDVLQPIGLPANAKVLGVRIASPLTPLASVYYQTGGKFAVAVVEVKTNKLVGKIDITKDSAFKPLLVR